MLMLSPDVERGRVAEYTVWVLPQHLLSDGGYLREDTKDGI